MNSHDEAIANELRKNNFAENNSIRSKFSGSKAVIIKFSAHFLKEKTGKPENESSLYDELDYGNYE